MKSTSYIEIFVGLDQFLPLWPVCLCSSVSYYSNTSNNILRMFTKFSVAPEGLGKTITRKSLSHVTPRASGWWDIKLFSTSRKYLSSKTVNRKSKLAFILPNSDGAKRIGPHNWDILSVLVGSLLGNCISERERSGGVRFWFKQFETHKNYAFWLYGFFNERGYCSNNLPVLYKYPVNSEPSATDRYYRMVTYRFTSLMWLHKLFFNHNKQKKVPKNIFDLLTPLSLAVWMCDRGSYYNSNLLVSGGIYRPLMGSVRSEGRIILHTNCFTKEEVLLLSWALETKFNIKSTLRNYHDSFLLHIKPESVPLLKKLLEPYKHIPTLCSKLGL